MHTACYTLPKKRGNVNVHFFSLYLFFKWKDKPKPNKNTFGGRENQVEDMEIRLWNYVNVLHHYKTKLN